MNDGVVTGLIAIACFLILSPVVGWIVEEIASRFR